MAALRLTTHPVSTGSVLPSSRVRSTVCACPPARSSASSTVTVTLGELERCHAAPVLRVEKRRPDRGVCSCRIQKDSCVIRIPQNLREALCVWESPQSRRIGMASRCLAYDRRFILKRAGESHLARQDASVIDDDSIDEVAATPALL